MERDAAKVTRPAVQVAEPDHQVYLSCFLKLIAIPACRGSQRFGINAPATKEEGHGIPIQLQEYLKVEKWHEATDPLSEQW